MSAYYDSTQWTGPGQSGWEHQTPPARSGELDQNLPFRTRDNFVPATNHQPPLLGASSAIPREESTAFLYQFEGT